ncbi:MAG: ABC transporter substrate-binding protein [Deltaproteobacteria bacterium]|nr:ABC transporter substrate-binding protein [Deltaproteobacteria bacterium]
MRIKLNHIVALFVVIALLILSTEGFCVKRSYPAGTPTRSIQDLDDMLDDFIVKPKGEKLTPEEDAKNRELKQKIIHGTFDIRELAELSLAKHWAKRTDKEQGEFVDLLTNLLEEKALFSKEQSAAKSKSGGKYTVTYRGHKFMNKSQTRAYVRTRVTVPSENITITLNYKLKKMDGEWKIYDIIVDQASLVANYKYQFNTIITKNSYNDLVQRMTGKLDELKLKRGADTQPQKATKAKNKK